jgi:hypothetical protein
MNYVEVFYKLGAYRAARDFESSVQHAEYDNPTQAPPKFASVDEIVRDVKEKLGSRLSRAPSGKGNRFAAIKKKLLKKKRK